MSILDLLHWLAALIVLAEGLNKLERVNLFCAGSTPRERCSDVLKVVAWMLLSLGSAGAVVGPFLPALGPFSPGLGEVLVMVGFATLVVRTRVEEGNKS